MILDLLNKKEKEKLKIYSYNKGKIIFHENDECSYVGIVVSGLVKIVGYSSSGNEIIYNEIKPGDLFGNNLLYSDECVYRGNVISVVDSKIVLLTKWQLTELLMSNKSFLEAYLKIESNTVKKLNLSLKLLSISSAEERLLYFLHVNNGKIKVRSITSLAERIFLTRETTSRVISKLSQQNIIEFNNKQLTLVN